MEYLIARAERQEKKAKKLLGWRLLAKKAAAKSDDAAHSYKEIAELYESQNAIEKAIEFFVKASNLFRQELSKSQCYEKAAQLAAQSEQYTKALVMYVDIANYSLNNIKLRHVKGHLFNAGICKLCRGDDAVAMAKEYADSYPSFRGTWHCDFLKDIAVSVEKRDNAEFNEAVENYKTRIPLDPWQTMMLLRVEKKLEASMSRSRTLGRTKTLDSINVTSLGDGGKQSEMCSSPPTGSKPLWSSSIRVTPRPFKALDSIVTTGGDGGKQRKMPTGLERCRTTTRGMSTATGISELLRSNSSRIEARVKETYSIFRHFKR